jgi:hypothetical protein
VGAVCRRRRRVGRGAGRGAVGVLQKARVTGQRYLR